MSQAVAGPVVAVVPARGGSKRIPRKNIRPFRGVPLLARTLSTILATGLFDRVIVSTDDDEVARVADEAGAEVPFRRPAALADDHTPTAPVVTHAIEALEQATGERLATVCTIYPTAVLVTDADLRGAAERLGEREDVDYVVPCAPFPAPVERGLRRRPDGSCELLAPEHRTTRTQDLPVAYHDAGQFYWGSRDAWVREVPVFGPTTQLYPLPAWRVQDIDTLEDWQRAELLHRLLEQG